MISPGTRLGPYEILMPLGAGGMGEVYRARDNKLKREVAIKVLPQSLAGDSEALARFEREALAVAALSHPNILSIFDFGTQDRTSYAVMELLEGQTLRKRLDAGPISQKQAVDYALQVAKGLSAAHEKGIVHRDLKPENLFVSRDGHLKILDFGLAKRVERVPPGEETSAPTVSGHTKPGTVMGTLGYMSPEQVRGLPVDHRSDIFSFGAILYELLSGQKAFSRATTADTMSAILNEQPPELSQLGRSISSTLDHIVRHCLEKDRDNRFQTAKDIAFNLSEHLSPALAGVAQAAAPAPRSWKTAAGAAALLLALVVTGYLYLHRAPKLTDKDTIVLANFENKTGDPVFDETLRQGLSVQLQQSPFLSLVSDERIRKTLAMMDQRPDARLTSNIAREVCVRTASAAVLEGSIASLGSQYVLGLRATNCTTGEILDDEQAQAARKEDVLGALSQIASRFRTRVGESLATVKRHDTPLEEATTPSLEALKAYSTAVKVFMSYGDAPSQPLLKRAIELDPKFAVAHAQLGINYSVLGESALARESTITAYRLRHRTSDRERFFITTLYDRQVTGNLEREQQTLESWARTYPRDAYPPGLLSGFATTSTGKYEMSIEGAEKSIALDPDQAAAYASKALSCLFLGRLADAEAAMQRLAQRKLDSPERRVVPYFIAFLRDDQAGMRRQQADAKSQPGGKYAEDMLSHVEALALARSGRLEEARRVARDAVDLAQQSGQRERAAMFDAAVAVWEALYGNEMTARRTATNALALGKGRDVNYAAAFALAVSGDLPRSRALADDLSRAFPEDTSVQFMYLPTLRALFALDSSQPATAVQELQTASRFDLAVGGLGFNAFYGALYPVYVRGEAYLAARQPAEAIAEFQKIINHRSVVLADPVDAAARLQLARAFVLSGDKVKAKAAYQDLLGLWKDADPNITMLKQAQTEYANLLSSGST